MTDEHADAQNKSTENFGHDDAVSEAILHEMALLHKKIDVYKTILDNAIEIPTEARDCVGYGK